MTDIRRRKLLGAMGASAVAVPVSAVIGTLPSHAQDNPMVDPASAQAQALQYVETSPDAAAVCSGCALYTGDDGAEAGPCGIFPGMNVTAGGWCSAYVAAG